MRFPQISYTILMNRNVLLLTAVLVLAGAGALSFPRDFAPAARKAVEIPPIEGGLDAADSEEAASVIQSGILLQDVSRAVPGMLRALSVSHVIMYDPSLLSILDNVLEPSAHDLIPQTRKVRIPDGFTPLPVLSLGPGWYAEEEGKGGAFSWMGEEAAVFLHIPPGPGAADTRLMRLIARHAEGEGELEVRVNGQTAAVRAFPSSVEEAFIVLPHLSAGRNIIVFRAKRPCKVPEGESRCLSFAVHGIGIGP